MSAPEDQGTRATEVHALPPPEAEVAFKLSVVEGPDTGRTLVLEPNAPRTLVGTGPACDLCLSDETVSRRHVVFERQGRRTRILDPGSTNGTFVDGIQVRDAFVSGGELVRLGRTAIRLEPIARTAAPPLTTAIQFGKVYGASHAMRRLYPLFERLAQNEVHLVIEGETGTGKENLAESIHETSRRGGPFVVFDCTAVSPTLVEAELFGHERGAFTGAVSSRPGMFELADGGTLFLDEIGDLSLDLQPKLLRAIERREIRRVGGQRPITVNVRIIAATRRNLDREVEEGRFRDDLFHRLAVARLELPPLRERSEDVALLARLFVEQMGAPPSVLSRDVLSRLEAYSWPGNIRDLRNAIARLVALGEIHLTAPDEQRESIPHGPDPDWIEQLLEGDLPFPVARRRCQELFEQRYVERLLEKHGGSVGRAAEASGVSERYFRVVRARTRGADSEFPKSARGTDRSDGTD
jgi:DNA-binding NtrC family response regulator